MHGLRTHPKKETTNGTGAALFASTASQEIAPTDVVLPFVIDSPLNFFGVGDNDRVIDISSFEISKDTLCVINSAFGNEPSVSLIRASTKGYG